MRSKIIIEDVDRYTYRSIEAFNNMHVSDGVKESP